MVALVPPKEVSKSLLDLAEGDEPLDEQHLTLLYLGDAEEAGGEIGKERLYRACYDFGLHSGYRGLTGMANGWGAFWNPESDGAALIMLWDIPGWSGFREALVGYCRKHGMELRQENHGSVPHQTMRYADKPITELPDPPEFEDKTSFVSIWIAWAGEPWHEVGLAN
jgi:hypothetical protein